MRQFLIRASLFVILYIGAAALVRFFAGTDYSWGNDLFTNKKKIVEQQDHKKVYTTLFFGSSRLYRQVDPAIFDSIVNHTPGMRATTSFNFSCSAAYAPELYMLCEHTLRDATGINTVFLELGVTRNFTPGVYSVRGGYWMDRHEFKFSAAAASESYAGNKIRNLALLTSCFAQNCLTIRQVAHRENDTAGMISYSRNGFYSLDEQARLENDTDLINRRYDFLSDTSVLQKQVKDVLEIQRMNFAVPIKNITHYQRLIALKTYCDNRKIQLYFVLPPRMLDKDVVELFRALPEENKIDLSDPVKYPEFYFADYSYDAGHLNQAGAVKFTEAFAKRFCELSLK